MFPVVGQLDPNSLMERSRTQRSAIEVRIVLRLSTSISLKRPVVFITFPEKPMDPLNSEQLKRHNNSTKCHICFKKFNSKNPKVRDHCHYTGLYRGPAHRNCNLMF